MPKKPTISGEEAVRRQQVVDSALGSLRLEGLAPSPEVLDIVKRFTRGEISLDEMSRAIHVLLDRRSVHVP